MAIFWIAIDMLLRKIMRGMHKTFETCSFKKMNFLR